MKLLHGSAFAVVAASCIGQGERLRLRIDGMLSYEMDAEDHGVALPPSFDSRCLDLLALRKPRSPGELGRRKPALARLQRTAQRTHRLAIEPRKERHLHRFHQRGFPRDRWQGAPSRKHNREQVLARTPAQQRRSRRCTLPLLFGAATPGCRICRLCRLLGYSRPQEGKAPHNCLRWQRDHPRASQQLVRPATVSLIRGQVPSLPSG